MEMLDDNQSTGDEGPSDGLIELMPVKCNGLLDYFGLACWRSTAIIAAACRWKVVPAVVVQGSINNLRIEFELGDEVCCCFVSLLTDEFGFSPRQMIAGRSDRFYLHGSCVRTTRTTTGHTSIAQSCPLLTDSAFTCRHLLTDVRSLFDLRQDALTLLDS